MILCTKLKRGIDGSPLQFNPAAHASKLKKSNPNPSEANFILVGIFNGQAWSITDLMGLLTFSGDGMTTSKDLKAWMASFDST